MPKLTAAARKRIPQSKFGLPGKAASAKGRAASGSYPMPDKAHAANAKSRAAQFATPAEKAVIDRKANKILGKKKGDREVNPRAEAKKKAAKRHR